MKKSVLMIAMMFGITFGASARHGGWNATDDAMKAFSDQYPDARIKKWEVNSCTDADIAKFKMDKRKEYAFYAPDGKWIKTETKIPWTKDLPLAVRDGFKDTRFSSWEIDRVNKVESPEGKSYTIQVHKDVGPDGAIPGDEYVTYVLAFGTDGTLTRKDRVNGEYMEVR